MTHTDSTEAAMLAAARRALSPTEAEAARVRVAVLRAAQIAAVGAAGAAGSALSGAVGAGPSRLASAVTRWSGAAAVAVAVGTSAGIGYHFGLLDGRSEGHAAPGTPGAPAVAEPAMVAPLREEAPPLAHLTPSPPPAREARLEARPAVNAPPAASVSEVADDPLSRELSTLRRVERLLREGNPQLARVLLTELDRAVPGGRLGEERFAAATVASCALDPDSAGARADAFAVKHPGSVYQKRVDRACAPSSAPDASKVKPR